MASVPNTSSDDGAFFSLTGALVLHTSETEGHGVLPWVTEVHYRSYP